MAQTPLGPPIQLGQEWNLVPAGGGGAVQLINRAGGLALDVANAPGVQNPSNPSRASQQWNLTPAS